MLIWRFQIYQSEIFSPLPTPLRVPNFDRSEFGRTQSELCIFIHRFGIPFHFPELNVQITAHSFNKKIVFLLCLPMSLYYTNWSVKFTSKIVFLSLPFGKILYAEVHILAQYKLRPTIMPALCQLSFICLHVGLHVCI